MSSDGKWNKGFKFNIEDREWIDKLFKERDVDKHPKEIDLAVDLFKTEYAKRSGNNVEAVVVLTPEQIEETTVLMNLCPRGLLKVIDTVATCTQRIYPSGLKGNEPFIYGKGYPNVGKVMRYEDIREQCESCTQKWSEKARLEEALKGFMKAETPLYFCEHPDVLNVVFTAVKEAKRPCPKQSLKEVRIDRTCINSRCNYIRIQTLTLPKVDLGS